MTTVYMSRKPEGKHSSNLFTAKLIDRFAKMGLKWTYDAKAKWDVGLVMISADDPGIFKRGPVVQRLDGIYFNTDEKGRMSNMKIRSCYERSAGVIFQSNLAKAIVSKNFGPPRRKSIVINNGTFIEHGVNAEKAIASASPELWERIKPFKRRMICVAKWRPIKRLSSIVNGAIKYIENDPDACLIIVGPFNERVYDRYKRCHRNVIYAGQLQNDLVRYLQILSDCCLNLSFTDSCPSVIVEAAAHGTPCVITKHQGVVDIITNEKDGIILDVDNWNYGPISYTKDIKEIPSDKVADAISKCMKIGKLPFRDDLDMTITTQKYIDFMLSCKK